MGKAMGKGGKGKSGGKNINDFEPAQKVWVGSLPEGVQWKELQTHFEVAGKVRWVETLGKGVACVVFNSEEEVAAAIATLNGSVLGGAAIQVDTWEAKPKKEGQTTGKGKGKSWGASGNTWQPGFEKMMMMFKGKMGMGMGMGMKGKG